MSYMDSATIFPNNGDIQEMSTDEVAAVVGATLAYDIGHFIGQLAAWTVQPENAQYCYGA